MKYVDSVGTIARELPFRKGTILVTGASGLIGTCIIDVLIKANREYGACFEIYALGRSITRMKKKFGEQVNYIEQDICEPLDSSTKFDYIIHAASNADPRSYANYPVETILTNILGSRNVLDYCKVNPSTRIVFTSSFEVYGEIENNDVYSEDMCGVVDFRILRNGYPESKRCAELLIKSYCDEYAVDAIIVRLSSIYGPTMTMNDSKAHAQFIKNALNKEDIVLKSAGEQVRTYCYVIDAVSAILTVLCYGKSGEVYNIANENSVASIYEVAKTLASIAGTRIVYDLPDEVERKGFSKPHNCILDNSKLKSLGWNGRYSLEEGLRETIASL